MENLSAHDLKNLILSVFSPRTEDKTLIIIVDVPDERIADQSSWKQRRIMAAEWWQKLEAVKGEIGLEYVRIVYYPNVHNNNADLPESFYFYGESPENLDAAKLIKKGSKITQHDLLIQSQIMLAPTQFSATAPLKLLSKNLIIVYR